MGNATPNAETLSSSQSESPRESLFLPLFYVTHQGKLIVFCQNKRDQRMPDEKPKEGNHDASL